MLVHFERNGEVLYDMWPMPGENPDGVCPAPVSPSGGGDPSMTCTDGG